MDSRRPFSVLDEHAIAVAVVWQHPVVQFFVADLHSATGPDDEDLEYGAQVDGAEVVVVISAPPDWLPSITRGLRLARAA